MDCEGEPEERKIVDGAKKSNISKNSQSQSSYVKAWGDKSSMVKVNYGRDGKVTIRIPYDKKLIEIYTHVSTKNLSAIKNLLDCLLLTEDKNEQRKKK